MYNIDKIIGLVTDLESTIELSNNVNNAKKSKIETLFITLNDEIIATYNETKKQVTDAKFADTITDIINDVISTTEKTSIHNIMLISEKILLNRNIKHMLISYTNARLVEKYSDFITNKDLKLSLSNDKETYNNNLKKVVKKAKIQHELQLINTHKELYNNFMSKGLVKMEVFLQVAKIAIKHLKANKED